MVKQSKVPSLGKGGYKPEYLTARLAVKIEFTAAYICTVILNLVLSGSSTAVSVCIPAYIRVIQG
jgi:hypothetical protein